MERKCRWNFCTTDIKTQVDRSNCYRYHGHFTERTIYMFQTCAQRNDLKKNLLCFLLLFNVSNLLLFSFLSLFSMLWPVWHEICIFSRKTRGLQITHSTFLLADHSQSLSIPLFLSPPFLSLPVCQFDKKFFSFSHSINLTHLSFSLYLALSYAIFISFPLCLFKRSSRRLCYAYYH